MDDYKYEITLRPQQPDFKVTVGGTDPTVNAGSGKEFSLNLERLERLAIEQALGVTAWHQGRAADILGVSDRTLHRKIKALGLRRPE